MKNYIKLILLFMVFMSTIKICYGETVEIRKDGIKNKVHYTSINDVPSVAWESLSKKRIYFGHQSVGYNIIDGVRSLINENPNIKLNIIEIGDKKQDLTGGYFAHSAIGSNRNPQTKNSDFIKIVSESLQGDVDIAFFKYCYVDINSSTDTKHVFENYKDTMKDLRTHFPNTLFVHFTVPLTSASPTSFKAYIKKMLGKFKSEPENNRSRNIYNDEFRNYYKTKDYIFDLAQIESTSLNGKRITYDYNGKKYFEMDSDYTSDGGHLNKQGQKVVARKLLLFLLETIMSQ